MATVQKAAESPEARNASPVDPPPSGKARSDAGKGAGKTAGKGAGKGAGEGAGEGQVFRGYQKGGKDNAGRVITGIFAGGQNHVVYKSAEGLHWTYNPAVVDESHLVAVADSTYRLKSLMSNLPGSGKKLEENIARAMHFALLGHPDQAKKILAGLEEKVEKQRRIWGQLRYLGSAALPVSLLVLISLFLAKGNESLLADRIQALLYVVTAGALAGFFSVATKLRNLKIDVDQPLWVDAAYGFSRIAIASIAAVFAYVLMKAGLFFSSLADSSAGVLAMAAAAGFSENLVPDLLERTAESQSGKKEETEETEPEETETEETKTGETETPEEPEETTTGETEAEETKG